MNLLARPSLSFSACAAVLAALSTVPSIWAQGSAQAATDKPDEAPALNASWQTRTEARALRLLIPAPRGQITDRDGFAMAQNRMAYRVGLNLPHLGEASESEILSVAKRRLAAANALAGQRWTLKDEDILEHYEHRRWLPLLFSGTLSDSEQRAIEEGGAKAEGLILHPFYQRHYPHGEFAPHVLGAIKKEIGIPTGPIADLDPIFEITKGRFGIEDAFDEDLTGKDGELNVLFDTDGTELSREIVDRPIPGGNVITTLDIHYQRYAEESLRKNTHGGAMVVIDAREGDILAMASYPSFDPNLWVDGLSDSVWKALQEDPRNPLYSKTFQAKYPPASTFKPLVALAALENGIITRNSMFACPTSMYIGDRMFRNWNKDAEGSLNVIGALKRSCNTWFYTVGMQTGSDSVLAMARNLGFGQTVGLPFGGENAGDLPNNEEHRKRVGFAIRGGDLANISIGQGAIGATPLQVARSMAALGTGEYLSQLRLVKQVQDVNNNVLRSFPVPTKTELQVSPVNLDIIREGMVAVVSGARGTGHRAAIEWAQVAGKTGTAQWNPAKDQNLAWFAGFVPAVNPRFAFAAVYEGDPGETVGGGSKAAPIVHDVLDRIYLRLQGEGGSERYEELSEDAPKVELEPIPTAVPLEAIPPEGYEEEVPVPAEPVQRRGIFDRLFRRNR